MRILIDLQACQTPGSRHRGIGIYSLSLAKAMIKNAGTHEIHILLNTYFSEAEQALRVIFSSMLPSHQIHSWHSLHPVSEWEEKNQWRTRASELIREQAIAELRPDIVHVSSLFEGLTDDGLSSVSNNRSVLTAVTLYDLIPLIHSKHYLANQQVRSWYFRKAQSLKNADLLLAISESSRQEGINWLNIPQENIVNISSAIDDRYCVSSFSSNELLTLKTKYQLNRPFVMYTGGIDLRKNIEGLISAFALLAIECRQLYQLAIVCNIQEADRERLMALAKKSGLHQGDLVLTGFVSDDELTMLYNSCELFVFPSWHEGFGLPALEAMSCGAPTIASNLSSLPEVVGNQEALFNPHDQVELSNKIYRVLNDQEFRLSLKNKGLEQAKKFSWDASALTALNAMEKLFEEKEQQNKMNLDAINLNKKPRLAYFSPLPNARSGIADYSADLLPELALYYDITLIVDQDIIDHDWLKANFSIKNWQWFDQNADQFDRVLYHFGNSTFHTYMFEMLEKHPGQIVLHDFYLSGIIYHLEAHEIQKDFWLKSLYESHGYQALINIENTENLEDLIYHYPCNASVINKAEGVIVHSEYSIELRNKWYGDGDAKNWVKIPLLRKINHSINRADARKKLNFNENDFVCCTFGIIGKPKLNYELVKAWITSSLNEDKNCHLIFVGQNEASFYGEGLLEIIAQSGAQDRIKITGFADVELFHDYLAATDVAVQLRGFSRGETSAAVLDCMSYGLPTIVNNNGSMAELPEHTLLKLPDVFSIEDLAEKIILLKNNSDLRETLGKSAKKYIHDFHHPKTVGKQYFNAIEKCVKTEPQSAMHRTLKSIASLDLPVTHSNDDVENMAIALSKNKKQTSSKQILLLLNVLNDDETSLKGLKLILPHLIRATPNHYRLEPISVIQKNDEFLFVLDRKTSCELLNLPRHSCLGNVVLELNREQIIVDLIVNTKKVSHTLDANFQTALNTTKLISFEIDHLLSKENAQQEINLFAQKFWGEIVNLNSRI